MERKAGDSVLGVERYHPLHQCSDIQLRLLILGDDETVNEEGEVIAIEVEEGKEEQLMECKIIGLCGVTEEKEDKSGPNMMKMTGTIDGIPLVVLVDSGASHNFISSAVVSVLGLKVDSNHQLGIKLGDGHRIQT